MKSRIAVFAAALTVAVSAVATPVASAQCGPTNTAGGGNCSAWASIKEALFGVQCGYYVLP